MPSQDDQIINWTEAIEHIEALTPRLAELLREHIKNHISETIQPRLLQLAYGEMLCEIDLAKREYVIFVLEGIIEVSDQELKLGENITVPFPRFVARPGTLVGVFELFTEASETKYQLYAGSKFGVAVPYCSNRAYLSAIAETPISNEATQHQAIEKRIHKLLIDKKHLKVILLPSNIFERVNNNDHTENPCRSYILEIAIDDYAHAMKRMRADFYRFSSNRPTKKEIQDLIESGFINNEILWHPLSSIHRLPDSIRQTSFGIPSAKEPIPDRRFLLNCNSEPEAVFLLPVLFGWHDISWGLLPSLKTPNTMTIHRNLSVIAWTPTHDRLGNCLIVCDISTAGRNKTARLNELLKAVLETSIPTHHFNSSHTLIHTNIPRNLHHSLELIIALKPSFFTDRLFSLEARRRSTNPIHVSGVQHLLRCVHEIFLQIKRTGFAETVTLLGKRYSSCAQVALAMSSDGISIKNDKFETRIGMWSNTMKEAITALLKDLNSGKHVLVDDGGYFLSLANTSNDKLKDRKIHIVAGVELTTSGILRMKGEESLQFPVINVAQSWAKRVLESPLIAAAIAKDAIGIDQQRLVKLEFIGILGAEGALGRSIHEMINSIRPAGLPPLLSFDYNNSSLPDSITRVDVLFGCTGTDVFAKLDPNYLKRILLERQRQRQTPLQLVSCSSGDDEFGSILRLSDQYGEVIPTFPAKTLHINLLDDNSKNTVRVADVLRAGFPVNFNNQQDSVPLPDIRLTTALLACGIVQASVFARVSPTAPHMIYQLYTKLQAIAVRQWLKATECRANNRNATDAMFESRIFKEFQNRSLSNLSEIAREYHNCEQYGASLPSTVIDELDSISEDLSKYLEALYEEDF